MTVGIQYVHKDPKFWFFFQRHSSLRIKPALQAQRPARPTQSSADYVVGPTRVLIWGPCHLRLPETLAPAYLERDWTCTLEAKVSLFWPLEVGFPQSIPD